MVESRKGVIFVYMQSLSVVIVCKNEAAIIGQTLQSLQGLSDDIIVYDNGSTDDTMEIACSRASVRAGDSERARRSK